MRRRAPQTQSRGEVRRQVKKLKAATRADNAEAELPVRNSAAFYSAVEATRLLEVVIQSSLFYPNCATASVGSLPEHLPNVFEDVSQYTGTFMPLLLEEAREGIKASFSDACDQDLHWDASIINLDMQGNGWLKVEAHLRHFHGKGNAPRLFQNAIVVLTNVRVKKKDPLEHLVKLLKKQKGVERQNKAGQRLPPATAMAATFVHFDPDKSVMTLRGRPVCDGHRDDPEAPCRLSVLEHLRKFPESWIVVPAGGLVTQQRECDILHSLNKIPIMDAILKPHQSLQIKVDDMPRKNLSELDPGLHSFVLQTYDPSQVDAILLCAAQFGIEGASDAVKPVPIVMIQGPPGTGKTHTVQGILNLWHLMQFERYYQRVISQYKGAGTIQMEKKSELAAMRSSLKPRILVCAPSNAAVDELLERTLAHGFRDSTGNIYKPHVVRIGAEDVAYSDDVRLVLLDGIVSGYMTMTRRTWDALHEKHQSAVQSLEDEVTEVKRRITQDGQCFDELAGHLLSRMERLERAQTELERLRLVEDVVDGTCANERSVREALELNFLDHAEMVFTTLSSTGRRALSRVNRGFETVLIDEAAQASEVAALQPLVYGCQQCVLVGDPQQLPATIISQRGKQLNMDRSLFARLKDAGAPVKLLTVQYRMHPWIREFPSAYFYENVLEDGRNVQQRKQEPFYRHDLLKPYVVFDVPSGVHERKKGGSLQNQVEADLAVALFKELRDFLVETQKAAQQSGLPSPDPVRVGVLTPYRSQTKCLMETFMRLLGPAVTSEIKIQTVDSCQGKQLDVVIFSCVRAATRGSGVGFIADVRRMNVAITRAKKALWILGNFKTLVSHPAWAALEKDAKDRECFVQDSTAQSLFPHQELFERTKASEQRWTAEQKPAEQELASSLPPVSAPQTTDDDAAAKDPRLGIVRPLVEEVQLNEVTAADESAPIDVKTPTASVADQPQTEERGSVDAETEAVEADPAVEQGTGQSQQPVQPGSDVSSPMHSAAEVHPPVSAPSVDSAMQPSMSYMLVRQNGAAATIAQGQGMNRTFLLVETPGEIVSVPVSVIFHGAHGLHQQLLQRGQGNEPSDADEAILQWLRNL